MKKTFPSEVQMIPVHQIDVINPRMRDPKDFSAIVANISNVGLKKPITVTPRRYSDPQRYYLVCGQGRLEAFLALSQEAIPAFVIDATEEECMIMSLVENIARRQHQPVELFQTISELKSRGYSNVQIGKKIGMSDKYVGGFVHLLENGEEGLIRAVANGNIPISVAMDIAGVEGKDAMQVLRKGYESGELRGAQFLKAKRLIERRLCWGKKMRQPQGSKTASRITSKSLMDAIQREAERQRFLVRESQRAKRQILLVETAVRKLRADVGFVNLLRALKLDDIPEMLEEKTR